MGMISDDWDSPFLKLDEVICAARQMYHVCTGNISGINSDIESAIDDILLGSIPLQDWDYMVLYNLFFVILRKVYLFPFLFILAIPRDTLGRRLIAFL